MAVAALAASLLLTACRVFTPSPRLLVMATALVPFALVGYAVAALAWWAVRRLGDGPRGRPSAVVLALTLAGLTLHAAWLVPSYAGSHASGRPDLVLMTSNLRLGQADTSEVADVARSQHVDVLVVEEVTEEAFASMAGLRERFPYVVGQPDVGAFGTVIFSRYPVADAVRLPVSKGTWELRVQAPTPFWFVGVHTAQPLSDVPHGAPTMPPCSPLCVAWMVRSCSPATSTPPSTTGPCGGCCRRGSQTPPGRRTRAGSRPGPRRPRQPVRCRSVCGC